MCVCVCAKTWVKLPTFVVVVVCHCGPKELPAFDLAYDRQAQYLTYKLVSITLLYTRHNQLSTLATFHNLFWRISVQYIVAVCAFFCFENKKRYSKNNRMEKNEIYVKHTCALAHLTLLYIYFVPFVEITSWTVPKYIVLRCKRSICGKQMKSENVNLLTISWNHIVCDCFRGVNEWASIAHERHSTSFIYTSSALRAEC